MLEKKIKTKQNNKMHPKLLKRMPFHDSPVETNSFANPAWVSWGSHNSKLSGLNKRNVLSHRFEGWSLRSRCWQAILPLKVLGRLCPSFRKFLGSWRYRSQFHMSFCLCVRVQNGPVLSARATLLLCHLILTNYTWKDLISASSHIPES